MIIGLILSTLHQLPEPEESIVEERHTLTSLALRHFPSETYVTARKRAGMIKRETKRARPASLQSFNASMPSQDDDDQKIPSLVEYTIQAIRTSPQQAILHDQARRLRTSLETSHEHLHEALKHNMPFYHQYDDRDTFSLVAGRPTKRKTVASRPITIYLSSATLVIVPVALLAQWNNEIRRHCHEDALRMLVLRPDTAIPPASDLASEYDVSMLTSLPSNSLTLLYSLFS
jgi:hypothetical protein